MADFKQAFDVMMENEGGYLLHTVEGDRGGMTYAGIARRFHPDWSGWQRIDDKLLDDELKADVEDFYRAKFWNVCRGDTFTHQEVATSIFDFAVNAGVGTSAKLAQVVSGADVDGVIGGQTVAAIHSMDPDLFLSQFALAKIKRYSDICNRDRSQVKFLLGWINRTLKG